MKKVSLGKSNIMVSPIGLGTMGMSEFYGKTNEKESLKTIHTAIDEGVNFFDTADMYGPFHNEKLLGKAIKGFREKVVIATKFGVMRDEDGTRRGLNGKPDYVKNACEESLKRLNIETIDLYYLHRKDPETPIEETVGAMAELVKEGKIRTIGLSEVSAETLKKAHAIHPVSALQSEYSLWSRDIENKEIPACLDLGVTLVAYSPLGRGFLTGKIKNVENLEENDWRRTNPRFKGENFQRNLNLLNEIEKIAQELNATPAQIALAWLLYKGDHIVPIPGTKREKYLKENIGAINLSIPESFVNKLNDLSNNVSGSRYTEDQMKLLFS